uniref:Uncharacterized protein n=1 Tax=Sinocyclocheilus rhinocerous TaxID=307959 RepID=A0A673MZS9_9TELE
MRSTTTISHSLSLCFTHTHFVFLSHTSILKISNTIQQNQNAPWAFTLLGIYRKHEKKLYKYINKNNVKSIQEHFAAIYRFVTYIILLECSYKTNLLTSQKDSREPDLTCDLAV